MNLIYIGKFLGLRLFIETDDHKRAKLAEETLTMLILREDTNIDVEIAKMKNNIK